MGALVLLWAVRFVHGRERDLLKSLGAMAAAGAVGIALVIYLYGRFRSGVATDQTFIQIKRDFVEPRAICVSLVFKALLY